MTLWQKKIMQLDAFHSNLSKIIPIVKKQNLSKLPLSQCIYSMVIKIDEFKKW